MASLRANPGLTSALGGVLFGTVAFVVGGGALEPVAVLLAVLIGVVFALAMSWSSRRRTRR
jgi:hypothetical protein